MFRSLLGGALALAYITAATLVYAADVGLPAADGAVSIPWGDWLAAGLNWASTIIIAAVAYGLRQLPSAVYAIIQQLRVEQLLERGLDFGLSATAGAIKGKALNVEIASSVIETAVEYAVANAPALVRYAGLDTLRSKFLARLTVAEDVTAADVGAALP